MGVISRKYFVDEYGPYIRLSTVATRKIKT